MKRNYKELSTCKICKKTFVVSESKSKFYAARYYCEPCYDKYFKDKKKED